MKGEGKSLALSRVVSLDTHFRKSSRNSEAGSTPVTSKWSSRARAYHVKQVTFGVVDLFEVRIVGHSFDPFL
jgi:hypothetical protein